MGLSPKQVSGGHGLGWGQSLLQSGNLDELPEPPPARRQQQAKPLACPRCGSISTKFCYYNNYNKSQPRHFCKACKRHWTSGGTLRNIPVGGGRKNKKLKVSNAAPASVAATATTAAAATTASCKANARMGVQRQSIGSLLLFDGEKNRHDGILYQPLLNTPSSSQQDSIANLTLSFSAPLLQNQGPQFNFGSDRCIESNPSSISTSFDQSSSDIYNYKGGMGYVEESNIADTMPMTATSNVSQKPWYVFSASSFMGMPSYWNLDDVDTLVSTQELSTSLEDTEIKPL